MSNEKVVNWLQKRGPVDLNDPMTRITVLGSLGSMRGVKRENVRIAIDAYVRSKKDAIIDTKKEREELALLITRQSNRNPQRVPLARAWGAGREMLRKRRWDFGASSGKGVRTFDKRWRGHLIADTRTKKSAETLASFLRRNNTGKVRVVPYQSGRRTHYSVYSERAVDIASRKDLKTAKKHLKPKEVDELNRRMDPTKAKRYGRRQLLTTRKNLPSLGIKMKRRGWK
jgi:hypothetical protein